MTTNDDFDHDPTYDLVPSAEDDAPESEPDPEPDTLTRNQRLFLSQRAGHSTDAACARAAGVTPGTANKWKRYDAAFLDSYNAVMAGIGSAINNSDIQENIARDLAPLAVSRIREILDNPVTGKMGVPERKLILDAATRVLAEVRRQSEDSGSGGFDELMVEIIATSGEYKPPWKLTRTVRRSIARENQLEV